MIGANITPSASTDLVALANILKLLQDPNSNQAVLEKIAGDLKAAQDALANAVEKETAAQEKMDAANKAQASVDIKAKAIDERAIKLYMAENEVSKREHAVIATESSLNIRIKKFDKEYADKMSQMDDREAEISKKEHDLAEKMNDANTLKNVYANKLAKLKELTV
jgi:hypothetical protein